GHARENNSIPVRDENCRTDVVEQHGAASSPDILCLRIISHRLSHSGDVLRDSRVVGISGTRPLWPGDGLRHTLENRRFPIEQSVNKRLVRIAPLTRPVDDVHLVALLEEERRPAAPAVRGRNPFGTLPVSPVNQNNRVRMPHLRGNPALDIHLHAVANRAARQQRVFDTIELIAPLGDLEQRSWINWCLSCDLRGQRSNGGSGGQRSKLAPGDFWRRHPGESLERSYYVSRGLSFGRARARTRPHAGIRISAGRNRRAEGHARASTPRPGTWHNERRNPQCPIPFRRFARKTCANRKGRI